LDVPSNEMKMYIVMRLEERERLVRIREYFYP